MPTRIIDMVRAKRNAMVRNPSLSGANMTLAVAAIKGGMGSREWKAYMMQFVEQDPPGTPVDPKRLERLLGEDNTLGDPVLDRKRCYLAGNGTCNGDTPLNFAFTVHTIDDGLDGGCGDPTPPPKNPGKSKPGSTRRKQQGTYKAAQAKRKR